MNKVDGSTKVCAILGDPVDHSLSPLMQNAAFESSRLNLVYVPCRVSRRQLPNAMLGLRSLRFIGANVTAPNKEQAMKLVDRVDSEARRIGAVNTIVNNGNLVGYNTDGEGAVRALREARIGIDGVVVTIIGSGGAAKAIAYSLAKCAREIRVFNRTRQKARKLATGLRRSGTQAVGSGLGRQLLLQRSIAHSDLLVNATPVSALRDRGRSLVRSKWLHQELAVFDVLYRPNPTQLVKMARSRGLRTVNGLGMLLHQGALSFELWTGKRAPVEVMRSALARVLRG